MPNDNAPFDGVEVRDVHHRLLVLKLASLSESQRPNRDAVIALK